MSNAEDPKLVKSNVRLMLRDVSWRDVFPWLVILRSFSLAISVPALFLATVAAFLTPVGWRCAEKLLLDPMAMDAELVEIVERHGQWPSQRAEHASLSLDGQAVSKDSPSGPIKNLAMAAIHLTPNRIESVVEYYSQPIRRLFSHKSTFAESCYLLFGSLWTTCVWAFFGGAITRIAVVKLGLDQRISFRVACQFTSKRYVSYLTAPWLPLAGILVIAIPLALFSVIMRFDFGVVIAGLLWSVMLVAGFLVALLLFGLLFGWPLMWPTISAEINGDAFEALQRSFSYVGTRPLHYLFYAVVATSVGAFGWVFIDVFAELVISSAYWVASWGAGSERMVDHVTPMVNGSIDSEGMSGFGSELIRLQVGVVRAVAVAYTFSFFWSAASAIYLLLRQDVDQTEFDEVFTEELETEDLLPATAVHTEPVASSTELPDDGDSLPQDESQE